MTITSTPIIQSLGYEVGHGLIKFDPERLSPLKEFPPPTNFNSLFWVFLRITQSGLINNCVADKIRPLANFKSFPLNVKALEAFNVLKNNLENVALKSMDKSKPFVVECDASDIAVSAARNQDGRIETFIS